ncbi:MAG: carbohydrate kinase family protein [Porphyromonadaceae bacterium]|nr:MAG: carbohydrate kinase family protein [Porphyromonadaceae bacterium]
MRKIIAIGESVLDTLYRNGQPVKAMVGGRIANATASLGMTGVPVTFCSECCTDSVGDIIVDFFNRHQVATTSIDRYTDGSTQLSAIFLGEDGNDKIVNYGVYPDADRFDVVWPRIDEGDIVLFGSLYSIAQPQRERVYELLSYAAERKAVMVYLPGFQHGINFRITRVLTAILETSNCRASWWRTSAIWLIFSPAKVPKRRITIILNTIAHALSTSVPMAVSMLSWERSIGNSLALPHRVSTGLGGSRALPLA